MKVKNRGGGVKDPLQLQWGPLWLWKEPKKADPVVPGGCPVLTPVAVMVLALALNGWLTQQAVSFSICWVPCTSPEFLKCLLTNEFSLYQSEHTHTHTDTLPPYDMLASE